MQGKGLSGKVRRPLIGPERGIMKVLFICTANLYRSQAAAAIGKVVGLQTQSAGVYGGKFGRKVPERLRETLAAMGYPLPDWEKSKLVTEKEIGWADSILYMIPNHLDRLQEKFPDCPHRKFGCLGEFLLPPIPAIPDPMFLKGQKCTRSIRLIEQAVSNLKRWT
jgi:protein-tyrosine-phosphatase